MYFVSVENQFTGSLNQFKFAVLEFNQTLKQRIELRLISGRLFYTKNGMFGLSESSCYQFRSEIVKLVPAAIPVVKLNPSFIT
jgi:hypothetical protein